MQLDWHSPPTHPDDVLPRAGPAESTLGRQRPLCSIPIIEINPLHATRPKGEAPRRTRSKANLPEAQIVVVQPDDDVILAWPEAPRPSGTGRKAEGLR